MRVRQAGERPSWLLPPGQSLAFTWSQPAAQPRTAEWCVLYCVLQTGLECARSVYGGEEAGGRGLVLVPGGLAWGRDRCLHRTVRPAAPDSDSDSDPAEAGQPGEMIQVKVFIWSFTKDLGFHITVGPAGGCVCVLGDRAVCHHESGLRLVLQKAGSGGPAAGRPPDPPRPRPHSLGPLCCRFHPLRQ